MQLSSLDSKVQSPVQNLKVKESLKSRQNFIVPFLVERVKLDSDSLDLLKRLVADTVKYLVLSTFAIRLQKITHFKWNTSEANSCNFRASRSIHEAPASHR